MIVKCQSLQCRYKSREIKQSVYNLLRIET